MYGVRHVSQDGESSKESICQSLRLGPTPKLSITVEGIEVKALVDTGCPATIISKTLCRQILYSGEERNDPSILEHRRQRARILHLNKPSLQNQAYSFMHTVAQVCPLVPRSLLDLKVGECQARGIVLVQENTPVDKLLGTNLMPLLGIQVL